MTASAPKPRLLIADDHEDVLTWVDALLGTNFVVVGTAEDGEQLVYAAAMLRPDLIIAEIAMPRKNGITSLREIRTFLPECKFVFLSMHNEQDLVREAFAAGASGFVLKVSADADLPEAATRALQGKRFVSDSIGFPA